MAEHMGDQFHGVTEAKRSTPLEGSTKNPQGRLFAPVGGFKGDPWQHAPENWMPQTTTTTHRAPDTAEMDDQGFMRRVPGEVTESTKTTTGHGDTVAWHNSESSQPPRYDDPSNRQVDEFEHSGEDWDNPYLIEHPETGEEIENPDYKDFSIDKKGRPMADYGSAVGMHLGTVQAATTFGREYTHPLRIPSDTIAPPPRGNFSTERPGGSIAAGSMRSQNRILNEETGERTEDTRWSDPAANFATKATDLVASGKTLAYRNSIEAPGSTSFRTLPETTRTWSEDVLSSRGAHPALTHYAEQGYNPVQLSSKRPMPDSPRRQAFDSGQDWSLRKPKPEDAI